MYRCRGNRLNLSLLYPMLYGCIMKVGSLKHHDSLSRSSCASRLNPSLEYLRWKGCLLLMRTHLLVSGIEFGSSLY